MNNKLEPTNAFMLKSNNKEYYKKVLFFSHFFKDYSQINITKKIHIYTLHFGTYKHLHAKKQKNNIKIIMAEVKLLVKNISL